MTTPTLIVKTPIGSDPKVPVAVSVCMPVYNGTHFLPRAFESLAAQTFQNFELIIVDDGSTDGSADAARALFSRHHLHGTIIRTKNCGPEHARDVARDGARGQYIAHLDCDDSWDPSYLTTMTELLQRHPDLDLVYCDFTQVAPDGSTTLKSKISPWINLTLATRDGNLYTFSRGQFFKLLLGGQVLFPSCTMYTKALATRTGPYTPDLADVRTSLDWYFGLRASRTGAIAFLNRSLVRRYLHDNNVSGDLLKTTGSNVRVINQILSDQTLTPGERRVARARGAMISTWAADISLRVNQNHLTAIQWSLRSIRYRPNRRAAWLLLLSFVPRALVAIVRRAQRAVRH